MENTKQILIVVPSRGRNNILERLIHSWATKSDPLKSDIIVVLDADDQHNYKRLAGISYTYYPDIRLNLVQKLNGEGVILSNHYPIVSFMGDDCVFMTPGWEDRIIEWQHKNKGICYCNDLLQGETLPNNVFIHSSIIQALGFMAPRELKHYYIDNYWKDLGIRLGKIKYFPEIVIEHKHWSNQKSDKDQTYIEAEKMMGEDKITWDKYREDLLAKDVEKIRVFQSNNL